MEKKTHKLLKHKITVYPLKKLYGTWAINDTDKVEIFRQHLSLVFQSTPTYFSSLPIKMKSTNCYQSLLLTLPPKCFSPNEIKKFIHEFSLAKSPGSDLITAKITEN